MDNPVIKLHLGCGSVHLQDWINIDARKTKATDVVWNLLQPLPYKDQSVDLIFCEHVFEHFSFDEGQKLLKDWHRVLKPGGRIRIGVPGLDGIIEKYKTGSWRNRKRKNERKWKKMTNAEYLNSCFYMWGHKFIYDEDTLKKALRDTGLKNNKRQPYGRSHRCPDLCNLETRGIAETDLIVEGER